MNGGVEEGGELVGKAVVVELALHGGHGGVGLEGEVVGLEGGEAEVGGWVGEGGEGEAAIGTGFRSAREEGEEGFEELEEEEEDEGQGEDGGAGGMGRHDDVMLNLWSLECHL